MPYNAAAVDWSEAHFDHIYRAVWWPSDIPVLVLAGAEDRIVWQGGWDDDRFHGPNVMFDSIPRAGHFPWIENPAATASAFARLVGALEVCNPANAKAAASASGDRSHSDL